MCVEGARVVYEKALSRISSPDLSVFVIWTPRYPGDDRPTAVGAMNVVPDSRATHFWDANGHVPRPYGEILKLPEEEQVAWDTYMLYGRDSQWTKSPPPPEFWMHQMSMALGRDHPRWLDGDKLRIAIDRLLP